MCEPYGAEHGARAPGVATSAGLLQALGEAAYRPFKTKAAPANRAVPPAWGVQTAPAFGISNAIQAASSELAGVNQQIAHLSGGHQHLLGAAPVSPELVAQQTALFEQQRDTLSAKLRRLIETQARMAEGSIARGCAEDVAAAVAAALPGVAVELVRAEGGRAVSIKVDWS